MHHNLSCIFTWFVACWHNLSWIKRAQICHHTTAVEGIHNLGTYGLWSMKDPYDKGLGIQGHIRSFWPFNHVYRQARVMRTYLILRDKVFSEQFFDTKKYWFVSLIEIVSLFSLLICTIDPYFSMFALIP